MPVAPPAIEQWFAHHGLLASQLDNGMTRTQVSGIEEGERAVRFDTEQLAWLKGRFRLYQSEAIPKECQNKGIEAEIRIRTRSLTRNKLKLVQQIAQTSKDLLTFAPVFDEEIEYLRYLKSDANRTCRGESRAARMKRRAQPGDHFF